MKRRTAAASNRPVVFETLLGAMLAIADDEGLRLLEFVDQRAMKRELSILRRRLHTNVVPGQHRHLDAIRSQLADVEMRRAVGRANGENMMCIIIPCHRVIRADGTLCGYGGGLWRKKWLLDHEQRFSRRI